MNPTENIAAAAREVDWQRRTQSYAVISEQLAIAAGAKKCHGCGCFQSTVKALSAQVELADAVAAARSTFAPQKYDCLGCAICFPAIAANAFVDAFPDHAPSLDLCPIDSPVDRKGWPPLPGEFRVLRYTAPVAVCTLNSADLMESLVRAQLFGVSIIGTLHTENLGIERVIRNVIANPNLRFLVLCGKDTQQAIGHLPGQSLSSLIRSGIDQQSRIVGSRGKRPVLKNVTTAQVKAFCRQVELLDLVGETSTAVIAAAVAALSSRNPGPFVETVADMIVQPVVATEPMRLVLDPAGFFVVFPDCGRQQLVLEHYSNAGVLDCVLHGNSPAALYGEAIARALVSRLDHAAYLGRELARAEHSLVTGAPFVQDRATGEMSSAPDATTAKPANAATSCDCAGECEITRP